MEDDERQGYGGGGDGDGGGVVVVKWKKARFYRNSIDRGTKKV